MRRHLDMPGVVRHRVGYVGLDTSGEALRRLGLIQQGESDGVRRVSCHVPEAERPVVGAAVEGVLAIVAFCFVGDPVDCVLGLADSPGVATGDGVVDWVAGINGCGMLVDDWEILGENEAYANGNSRHRHSRGLHQCLRRSYLSRRGLLGWRHRE